MLTRHRQLQHCLLQIRGAPSGTCLLCMNGVKDEAFRTLALCKVLKHARTTFSNAEVKRLLDRRSKEFCALHMLISRVLVQRGQARTLFTKRRLLKVRLSKVPKEEDDANMSGSQVRWRSRLIRLVR